LTGGTVPVLSGSAGRAADDPEARARVAGITSAVLTWTVIILVPLVAAIMLAAGPIASLLTPVNANAHCVRADVVGTTSDMLVVFAPQALLYGLSVVLYGLLQSYRPFAPSGPGDLRAGANHQRPGLRPVEQGPPAGPAAPPGRADPGRRDHARRRRP